MIVDIYDNLLEDHVAEYIHMEMKNLSWKYDYPSNKTKPNLHWHIFAGHDPEEVIKNGYDWLLPIWNVVKLKCNFETKYFVEDFVRLYMNAHTHGIEPHIPLWDKSQRRDGTFSRADFTYDRSRDLYLCPGGKELKTTGRVHEGRTRLYRAGTSDCGHCAMKQRCCPNTPHRRVPRDIDEEVREQVRALADTPAFRRSRDERKKVEMAFAHIDRKSVV